MSDILFVHDLGQGSWCWGRVWGLLTAPVDNPPRLHSRSALGKVDCLDFPVIAPTPREDTSVVTLDDYVSAVTTAVASRGLRDLILVGHGLAAPVLLQAAANLKEHPKRIVLFAGLIPDEGKSALDMLPIRSRMSIKGWGKRSRAPKKNPKLPRASIYNVYCNGMDVFDIIKYVGRFRSPPSPMLRTRVQLDDIARTCPISYVPLGRDRLVPMALQRRIAGRLGDVEVADTVDSCHEVMIERPQLVADLLLKYA